MHHHNACAAQISATRLPPTLRHQQGFSLIEIGVVTLILALLATIGIPAVKGFIIEARVPAVANELQRFMTRTKIMGEGDSITPYASIDNAKNLAPALKESSVFKVNNTTVAHRLGGTGSGTSGTMVLAPAALGGGSTGSAFSLTLTNVNDKACPTLASIMNAVSETISVNGTVAKALGTNNAPGSFNPVTAQDLCVAGDSNTFVFATR